MTTVSDIVRAVESLAPASLAEQGDPVGLQIGDANRNVRKIVVALDASADLVERSVIHGMDAIVTHHPLIFAPLKTLTPDDPVAKRVLTLAKAEIALITAHTCLDRAAGGTNDTLTSILGLEECRNFVQVRSEYLYKVVVFVPIEAAKYVRKALGDAGAGHLGNYSHCAFWTGGSGSFLPLEGSHPYIGSAGQLEEVTEVRIETVCSFAILDCVIQTMLAAHPYEEVAYDIYPLANSASGLGLGRIGVLPQETKLQTFAQFVNDRLELESMRVAGDPEKCVKTVAVCAGAGSQFYREAAECGADVLVTGDSKHHHMIDAAALGIGIIDAGHFETEKPGVVSLAHRLGEALDAASVKVEYWE